MNEVFFTSWNERRFRNDQITAGVSVAEAEAIQFRQDNHSRSSRGSGAFISRLHPNLRAN